jgi:putative membrane protein
VSLVTAEPRAEDDTGPDVRWALAAERTLLAWFRLALGCLLLGLALLALVPPGTATVLVCTVVAALMAAGAAAAVVGVRRWHRAAQRR